MSLFGFEDRNFYQTLRKLALPLMLLQAISSSISLVSNLMIGSMGDNALAALNHATQINYLLTVFLYGITSASSAFTAQFWGKKDVASVRRMLGITVVFAQAIGWTMFILGVFFPRPLMLLFTQDEAVLQLSTTYLSTVAWGFPVLCFTQSFNAIHRGTENVKLPVCCSITGLCASLALNYVLISGRLGFPALGVKGAALAAVAAWCIDDILLISFTFILKKPAARREYPLFPIQKSFLRRFGRMALPTFINESLYSLSSVTIALIYAQLGTAMSAAANIYHVVDRLCIVAVMGMSNGCAIHLGKTIGSGNEALAQSYGRRYLLLSPCLAAIASAVVLLLRRTLLGFYAISGEAEDILLHGLIIFALYFPLFCYNYTMVIGILRGGGDARFSLYVDAGTQWLITIAVLVLAAFVFHIPPKWIFLCLIPGEIAKFILGRHRFKSGRWIHNLTLD